MTSTVAGLPERYRPLDQVGPDEHTSTGVIQTWRAKDRVLNRDVAVRVHTPAGPAAHAWITRALTAGGLATPALAMVYDASEGSGDPQAPGGAAYVVNEWIDGVPLADRLLEGPLPEREIRTVLRRLAEGVAEAHRVGLAVGGLTPGNVVLRPNGLVGLRGVPAAEGTIDGDVAALGDLLQVCLTGLRPDDAEPRALRGPSDLVALARRARSIEAGQGLSSVAAMAAILAERPRTRPTGSSRPESHRPEESDHGWLGRLRDRNSEDGASAAAAQGSYVPVRLDPTTLPPVPPVRPVGSGDDVLAPGALGGDTVDANSVAPVAGAYAGAVQARGGQDGEPGSTGLVYDLYTGPYTGPYTDTTTVAEDEDAARRHRLVVIGLPLLALLVVVALAWWVGTSLLSVAGSVDEGATPSVTVPTASPEAGGEAPAAGTAVEIQSAEVFDPEGDGEPENDDDVPLTIDGDAATTWSTLTYRGSPAFGNLKPGVGILYDLGAVRSLSGLTIATPLPGATVEIRTGEIPAGDLDGFALATGGTLEQSTDLLFDEQVEAQYVLLWVTGLVDGSGGFVARIGEVTIRSAG